MIQYANAQGHRAPHPQHVFDFPESSTVGCYRESVTPAQYLKMINPFPVIRMHARFVSTEHEKPSVPHGQYGKVVTQALESYGRFCSIREIADKTGLAYDQVQRQFNLLGKAGEIEIEKNGRFVSARKLK